MLNKIWHRINKSPNQKKKKYPFGEHLMFKKNVTMIKEKKAKKNMMKIEINEPQRHQ